MEAADSGRVARFLADAGCSVIHADGRLALVRTVAECSPDGVVLAAGSSDEKSIELIQTLVLISDAWIAVLVADEAPALHVRLLDAGASDVVAADIGSCELLARLRARLREASGPTRRAGTGDRQVIRMGGIEIDRGTREVRKDGKPIPLTRTEYEVLTALAADPGSVVTPATIATAVWGDDARSRLHSVRVYIGYLRRKIEDDPSEPRLIVSRWGMGYQLLTRPADSAAPQ